MLIKMKSRVKKLLKEVRIWAENQPEILGVALVGSYAREAAKADSDVDLILIASQPQDFITSPEWVNEFGPVKSFAIEDWGLVTSLRVYYQDGLEVEYGLTSNEWASEPVDEGTRRVISDGMRILLDKTGSLKRALKEVTNE